MHVFDEKSRTFHAVVPQAKVYEDDHVRQVEFLFQRSLAGYEEMSSFCRVTPEGDVVAAGLLEETNTWELRCFHVNTESRKVVRHHTGCGSEGMRVTEPQGFHKLET